MQIWMRMNDDYIVLSCLAQIKKSKKGTIIRDFDVKLNPSPSHSYGQYHVTKPIQRLGQKKKH